MSAPATPPDLLLVTGGAGFIGSHLVDALLAGGARVRVLDDLSTGRRENLAGALATGRLELLVGDLRDPGDCRRACRGARVVFHLAAVGSVPRSMDDPAGTLAVNSGGTANLLAAAREEGVRRVVLSSSSSVYGDSEASPKREGEEGRPLSPYALSKRIGEELAETFGRCFGLETIALRYFNVYGPRQDPDGPYAAVIPRFFDALLAGRPATLHGHGRQSRDFTFVADAVASNLAAAAAPAAACGRAYNVGTGRSTTLLELERRIRELAGGGPAPVFAAPRAGDVLHSLAATEEAERRLGFVARTPLAAGLAASLEHYRESAAALRSSPSGSERDAGAGADARSARAAFIAASTAATST
jgi:nucleoside-diphosphate-sugar epimerase